MRLGRSPFGRQDTKVSHVSTRTYATQQGQEARPLLRTITSSRWGLGENAGLEGIGNGEDTMVPPDLWEGDLGLEARRQTTPPTPPSPPTHTRNRRKKSLDSKSAAWGAWSVDAGAASALWDETRALGSPLRL